MGKLSEDIVGARRRRKLPNSSHMHVRNFVMEDRDTTRHVGVVRLRTLLGRAARVAAQFFYRGRRG